MKTHYYKTVTIDGPAASGKSTTARLVAEKLGWIYLDTGAMYRSVALKVLRAGMSLEDTAGIARAAEEADIRLIPDSRGTRVILDGQDVTHDIRTADVDRAVGPVCEVPRVRELMVALQRTAGERGDLVAEGRDMGTVVFPDAFLKFYMQATVEERALRRKRELAGRGIERPLDEIRDDIVRRDARDSQRSNSPLKRAEDACDIDTTRMSIAEQVKFVTEQIKLKERDSGC
ncbi:(d)CMP kinase [bacterium]|nr:(d)CMP kinase [bacterium]